MPSAAPAKMQSVELGPKICETTNGGRFVRIPQFPGEKIDRRLLDDVKFMVRKYKIFVTDGYSLDPVHSANGEHPIGLALDIVPDFANGGSWKLITRLAKFAEPRQNQPRAPFRWVGYDGDAGHGRGHHLHLSFNHSASRYNKPAKTIYSMKCPVPKDDANPAGGGDGGSGGSGSGGSSGGGNGGSGSGGGIGARMSSDHTHGVHGAPGPAVAETGGVDG